MYEYKVIVRYGCCEKHVVYEGDDVDVAIETAKTEFSNGSRVDIIRLNAQGRYNRWIAYDELSKF